MSSITALVLRTFAPSILAGLSVAQVQVEWATFCGGGPGAGQLPYALAVDGAGATFVAGARDVDPTTAVSYDAVLTKIDSDGVVEWTRTYDEPTGGSQGFDFLGVDPAGNVVVAGPTSTGTRTIVARYDTTGNQLWLRVLAGPSGEALRVEKLRVAPDGDVVLAGYVGTTTSLFEACAVRLRSDGTTAWTYVYTGSSGTGSSATEVVLDAGGSAYVTGQAVTSSEVLAGLFALKLTVDGALVWSTEVLPPATLYHQSNQRAAVDAQGRLYVADGIFVHLQQFLGVTLFDANGALLWERRVPSDDTGSAFGLAVRADGSVLVGAQLSDSSTGAVAFVGAWDVTGTALWSASYIAPGFLQERVSDFDLDPSGGAILTGSNVPSSGRPVVFAAHFTDAGQQDWTQLLASEPAGETLPALAVAADDSLRIHSRWNLGPSNFQALVRRLEHDVTAFCSGDGSATACPCANSGAPRSGCANSLGVGAALRGFGGASLALDTLSLACTDLPTTTVTFFQGTERVAGGSGLVFGDGLRCAGGTVVRLGTLPANSTVEFPSAGSSLSVLGQVTTPGLRTYQCWYRNSASFCTPATFNLSNGLAVLWRP